MAHIKVMKVVEIYLFTKRKILMYVDFHFSSVINLKYF